MKKDPIQIFQDYLDSNLAETIFLNAIASRPKNNIAKIVLTNLNSNNSILFNSFLDHHAVVNVIPKLYDKKCTVRNKLFQSMASFSSDWVEKMNIFHLIGSCARIGEVDVVADVSRSYNEVDIVAISLKNMQILYGSSRDDSAAELICFLSDNPKLLLFYKKYVMYYYSEDELLKALVVALSKDMAKLSLFAPIIFSLGYQSQFSSKACKHLINIHKETSRSDIFSLTLRDYPLIEILQSWTSSDRREMSLR